MNSNLVLDYSWAFSRSLSLVWFVLVQLTQLFKIHLSLERIKRNLLHSFKAKCQSFQRHLSHTSTKFLIQHSNFFPSLFLFFPQPPPGNICILVYSEAFFNVALHSPECRKLLPSKVSYTKEELCGGRWYLSIQPIFRDSTPLRRELLCSSSHSLTGD